MPDPSISAGPGASLLFTDPGSTISPGSGCVTVTANQVSCNESPGKSIRVSLGDRDDKLTVELARSVLASGDAGNDQLTGGPAGDGLWGGDGDDRFDGRGGADFMSGQEGSDHAS